MALQKAITTNTGIEAIAYFKMRNVDLDYSGKNFNLVVEVYFSKATRDEGKLPLDIKYYNPCSGLDAVPPGSQTAKFDQFFSCSVMDSNGNAVHQSYEFLKTLEEFQGAEDI